MKLSPFLLDHWLDQKSTADPRIEYDLGLSTGPSWTLRELLALGGGVTLEQMLDTKLVYSRGAGALELREAIGAMESVDPDHVQVFTGGAEALLVLFFLASEPGANVVLPKPGFPTNTALADAFQLEVRNYSLRAEDGFRIDPDEIRGLVDRNTRFVLLNSPHNPTGTVLTDQEIESLHDFCFERGVQLVVDQVYHPIYHGPATRSASRLPHAIVVGDFSKALCLSGLRIGWMIDRDAERREQYLNARSYFTATSPILSERLAALAVRNHETIYGRARGVASANLALLDKVFAELGDVIRWVRPRGGMTAFPSLADGSDAREFCRKLMKRGVLLVPGDCFGMPSHFRLGFAASGDRFPAGLERFAESLAAERQRHTATTSSEA